MRSLDLLWSADERPAPGPRPGLSVAKIVRTAIGVADSEGLTKLSMQRVAGELGYTAMSLYRHVPGKSQLVAVMADVASGPPPELSDTDAWRQRVEAWVDGLWEVYRRHPWLVEVQLKSPPVGPNGLAWIEALLRAVRGTGLGHDEVLGLAMFMFSAVRDLARLADDLVPMGLGYPQILEKIVDGDRFPMLAELATAMPAAADGSDGDGEVRPVVGFGIRLLLDGVESYVRDKG
ncbi:TetR/AcrR family transcriptional regulator C-terminal domain-containing protein [Streptomyces sp. M2CJ-2]|nr:TetR/AcrR family transcriptional regulator C-terminal domain-containing protein [Streptomyces sp. M2CJ-2]